MDISPFARENQWVLQVCLFWIVAAGWILVIAYRGIKVYAPRTYLRIEGWKRLNPGKFIIASRVWAVIALLVGFLWLVNVALTGHPLVDHMNNQISDSAFNQ